MAARKRISSVTLKREKMFYMDDGKRSVDFVLVYSSRDHREPVGKDTRMSCVHPGDPRQAECSTKAGIRALYERHLTDIGLELEKDYSARENVVFVKVHAPFSLLVVYADSLKIRLPPRLSEVQVVENFLEKIGAGEHDMEVMKKNQKFNVPILRWLVSAVNDFFTQGLTNFPDMPLQLKIPFNKNRLSLFDIPTQDPESFFPWHVRVRIVDYILREKETIKHGNHRHSLSITELLSDGVYAAVYPLHDGRCHDRSQKPIPNIDMVLEHGYKKENFGKEIDAEGKFLNVEQHQKRNLFKIEYDALSLRQQLHDAWANFYYILQYQPLDYIRMYFGEKIGLYFAFLGFYTMMLIPLSIAGVITIIYGGLTRETDVIVRDVCDNGQAFIMCPSCDASDGCDYWTLDSGCSQFRLLHVFDNEGTVVFAFLASMWAVVFLELWKRYQSELANRWKVSKLIDDTQVPRPEFLAMLRKGVEARYNFSSSMMEPYFSFWKFVVPCHALSMVAISIMLFLALLGVLLLTLSQIALGKLIIYIQTAESLNTAVSVFREIISYFITFYWLLLLENVYVYVARSRNQREMHRTEQVHEKSLVRKLFLFNFVNYFSYSFYAAFIKHYVTSRPWAIARLGELRIPECGPGGCLADLAVGLLIYLSIKVIIIANFRELVIPKINKVWKKYREKKSGEQKRTEEKQWSRDFVLDAYTSDALLAEFFEMIIQFGFVTLFVAAFPVAPLLALANNVLEIRIDSNKLITQFRRPVPYPVKDIGIWYTCLKWTTILAVFTNALIIAFTSDLIPRTVYYLLISPQQSGERSLTGYLNATLSRYSVEDLDPLNRPPINITKFPNLTECLYRDYRNPPDHERPYDRSALWWKIFFARLSSILIFLLLVFSIQYLLQYLIPDEPKNVRRQVEKEFFLKFQLVIKAERKEIRRQTMDNGLGGSIMPQPLDFDLVDDKEEMLDDETQKTRKHESQVPFQDEIEHGGKNSHRTSNARVSKTLTATAEQPGATNMRGSGDIMEVEYNTFIGNETRNSGLSSSLADFV